VCQKSTLTVSPAFSRYAQSCADLRAWFQYDAKDLEGRNVDGQAAWSERNKRQLELRGCTTGLERHAEIR
jgi:hypothetical protein